MVIYKGNQITSVTKRLQCDVLSCKWFISYITSYFIQKEKEHSIVQLMYLLKQSETSDIFAPVLGDTNMI